MDTSNELQNAIGQTTSLQSVAIKLPPFWPADPALWFSSIEAQFALRGVTTQQTKFYYVVAALGPQEAAEVRDVIMSPPAETPYDRIKEALTKRTTATEQERLQQLLSLEVLGDRKPSQLLRRMQQLLGDQASKMDDSFVRHLFLQRLPSTVRMILTAATAKSTEVLAQMADNMMDACPPTIAATEAKSFDATAPGTADSANIESLRTEVAQLSALVTKALQRQKSPGPRRRPSPHRSSFDQTSAAAANSSYCWYHASFGSSARRCRPPCSFAGNANTNN